MALINSDLVSRRARRFSNAVERTVKDIPERDGLRANENAKPERMRETPIDARYHGESADVEGD